MTNLFVNKAAEIIKRNIYVTLATVNKDGQPWNSPLSVAFDKDLNFYTNSDKNSIHAVNIRDNGKVFFVLYDSTIPESTGAMAGIYIQGKGYVVNLKEEILSSRKISLERKGKKLSDKEYEKFSGNSVRRIYKLVPEKMWINDVEFDGNGNYVRDIRVEIPLEEVKKLI